MVAGLCFVRNATKLSRSAIIIVENTSAGTKRDRKNMLTDAYDKVAAKTNLFSPQFRISLTLDVYCETGDFDSFSVLLYFRNV